MPSLPRLKNSDNLSQWGSKINEGFQTLELVQAESISPVTPQNSGEFIVFWGQSDANTNKAFGTHYNTSSPYQDLGDLTVTIPTNNQIVREIRISDAGINYAAAPYVTFSNPYPGSTGFPGATGTTINSVVGSTGFAVNTIVSSAFAIAGATGVSYKFYKATTAIAHNTAVPLHSNGLANNWLFVGRNARLTVTVSGGNINGTTINDGGYGYSTLPTVTITPTSGGTQGILTPVMYCDVVAGLTDGSIENKPLITSLTDVTRATDYLLVYDSYSGATSFANSLKKIQISTITPDVPTGSVLFGSPTDSYIWDSTNFHWDDTNNRLGLGTNTPDALLTVNGVGAFGNGSVSVPSISNIGDLNTGFWFPAADTIAASTAGVERIRVLSTGEIGIGTASPSVKLQVVGGRSSFAAASEPFAVGARYISTGGDVYFGATNGTATPDAQISAAGGVALMTLQHGGNVGIGTSTPSQKLHVVGSGAVVLIDSTSVASANPELRLAAVGRQFNVGVGGGTFATTALQGSYYIYDATAAAYRFVIDVSGRVGIGTTSPGATLHVFGNNGVFGTSAFFSINSSTAGIAISNNGTIGVIQGMTTATSAVSANIAMQLNGGGFVGIGAAPGVKLDVTGASSTAIIRINSTDTTPADLRFATSQGTASIGMGIVSGTGFTNNLQFNATGFHFQTGNVGIGTTSPLALRNLNLEIGPQGTNDGAAVIVNKKGSGVATLRLATQGAASGFDLNFNSPTTGYFGIYDIIATANRLVIDTAGNIGIGATTPEGKLTVVGGRSYFSAVSEPFGVGARFISTGGTVYFGATNGTATPDAQISSASGAALLTLFNNGNVSIGTITSGIWNGTVIAGLYGGTGVANSGKTITLGGNLTTSGAFAVTLTATNTTSVTLPTSGTLATLANAETLTNKTIAAGSNTISGLVNANLSGTAGITNANLANSAVTIGSTSISLGSSSTTLAGLTSVTSTTFTGALTGNATTATTATNLAGLSLPASGTLVNTVGTGASGTWGINITGTASSITSQANSATINATSSNVGSQIVLRDASGNFTAGTITAALSGNATTATTATSLATSRNFSLSGDVTSPTVAFNGTGSVVLLATIVATTIPAGSNWAGNPIPVLYGGTGNSTGNAVSATTLQTSRNFSLTGAVTAGATGFNGSANVTLTTSIGAAAVTNDMLAGSIANSKLSTSSITINGSAVSLGGSITIASVGGTATQVQFNNAGALAGSANMTFDGTRLTVAALTVSGNLTGTLSGNATTASSITSQANSATINATSSNVGSQIVLRDASGNFTAGTITAALSGNATTATTATNLAGLSLPASGALVNTVGTGASGTWGINITGNAATASSITSQANSATITASLAVVANTIVLRDAAGDFNGRFINATYYHSTDDISTANITHVMAKFGDNYHRSATAAKVAAFISGQSMSIVGNATTATTASSITSQANSATINATSSNVGSQIVLRDASGNFTAGTITAGSYGAVTAGTGNFSGQIRASAGQSSGVIANANISLGGIEVYGGGGANAAFITFHRPGVFAAYFGLDGTEFKVGGWSMGWNSYTLLHSANYTSYAPSLTGSGASGTWGINITGQSASCSGNAATATSANTAVNLSTTSANWSTNGVISAVVGQLAWKHYANGHTIFDASNGTSPTGSAVNNTNSTNAWSATYPTLMGWNRDGTYGVRVDSARISDSTTGNAGSITGQANSATINATSSNVGSQIVLRDASGNFTAGTITAGSYGAVSASTGAFSGKVSGSGASYRLVLPVGTNFWAT